MSGGSECPENARLATGSRSAALRQGLRTRDSAYFENLYTANPDPWNFTESSYEQDKYAATLGMLGGRSFSRGLEVGCSIGVLTKLLASHCSELLAVDIVEQALSQARERCALQANVTFERMHVPEHWPAGYFDLMVFSEILYFLDNTDIARTASLANASLTKDGILLLVNYTETIDEPCTGNEAAELFLQFFAPENVSITHLRNSSFRIDVLERRSHSD